MSASWLLSQCQTNWSPLNAAATHQDATHDMARSKSTTAFIEQQKLLVWSWFGIKISY